MGTKGCRLQCADDSVGVVSCKSNKDEKERERVESNWKLVELVVSG